jgi:excisionase family DNA binding protein
MRADWDSMPIAQRRAIVASELDHARVGKATPSMTFDSARFAPLWWEALPIRPRRVAVRRTFGKSVAPLTTAEAAEYLGVRAHTLRDLARAGKVPTLPDAPRGRYRFDQHTLIACLDEARVQPQARFRIEGD